MTKKIENKSTAKLPPDYIGHRQRLRERFLRNGFDGMLDYEILEMLLMTVIPRKDVKPIARQMLKKFNSITSVLSQPYHTLLDFPGLGPASAINLKMIFATFQYCLLEKCRNRDVLNSTELIRNFARMKLGVRHRESYMMIFLDSRNQLIDYSIIAEGSIDHVINYVRNIVESTIELKASKLIMVHNHPSGVCYPSAEDIQSTHKIYNALQSIDAVLEDHLIVSACDCFSFVDNGLSLNSSPDE